VVDAIGKENNLEDTVFRRRKDIFEFRVHTSQPRFQLVGHAE